MKTYELIKQHNKAIMLLNLIERHKIQINNMETKIAIEDAKDYINSYLLTPKWWYEKQIENSYKVIELATKRYEKYYIISKN